jgi:hypothetical protein
MMRPASLWHQEIGLSAMKIPSAPESIYSRPDPQERCAAVATQRTDNYKRGNKRLNPSG